MKMHSGLAIAAVLAFHLNDATFPAGFVGVDMLFFCFKHETRKGITLECPLLFNMRHETKPNQ